MSHLRFVKIVLINLGLLLRVRDQSLSRLVGIRLSVRWTISLTTTSRQSRRVWLDYSSEEEVIIFAFF